ncbi:MAG: ribulose-phosphate 3-epimerase [Acholeplasmatales bacterium]|jgi:ribulose-phosphate 3-epimerase|nr:ribulose-phosphate 3-epimerase [Acholeplasmatales bacterium]
MICSPSILSADFKNLEKELKSIQNSQLIHLDIMDGNFVPNISFGPAISSQVASLTKQPLDIHLMIFDPLPWIERFIFPTTKYITVHGESKNALNALKLIKEKGIKAGICLKPKTKVHDMLNLINLADLVLVMTVEPGFSGQAFLLNPSLKIEELIRYRKANKLNFVIEVDGGINNETIKKVANADIVVMGSYLFSQKNRQKIINDIQKETK